MENSSPSALPRVTVAVLLIALAFAVVYIVQLRRQLVDLRAQLTAGAPSAQPAPAAAPAGAAAPAAEAAAPVAAVDFMTAEQKDAMLRVLKAEADSGRKVWFHVHQNNAEASGAQAALARVFADAGWPVETVHSPYPLKPGVFLLAADSDPPTFVNTVSDAFSAAGFDLKFLTGYREYFAEKKKANPNWSGPELGPGQPFVLVIGSRPAPKTAED